jgi:hypothetical protein
LVLKNTPVAVNRNYSNILVTTNFYIWKSLCPKAIISSTSCGMAKPTCTMKAAWRPSREPWCRKARHLGGGEAHTPISGDLDPRGTLKTGVLSHNFNTFIYILLHVLMYLAGSRYTKLYQPPKIDNFFTQDEWPPRLFKKGDTSTQQPVLSLGGPPQWIEIMLGKNHPTQYIQRKRVSRKLTDL